MDITYCIIAYKNHLELDYLQYGNLEEMLNFIKEYENEANEYKIMTYINGIESARDTIVS